MSEQHLGWTDGDSAMCALDCPHPGPHAGWPDPESVCPLCEEPIKHWHETVDDQGDTHLSCWRTTVIAGGGDPDGQPTRGARASSECPDPTGQPGTTEPTAVSRSDVSRGRGTDLRDQVGPEMSA